jgi:HlyD family secretion protein
LNTVIVKRRNGALLRQLQTLYNIGTIGDLTDGQLLERFATDADEVAELAFSALVERHQAMVWRVCLSALRNQHEAEDAFQATFLVLVRKARSLWVQDSLGPWLHQVACRTAFCLRATVIRRREHEHRCAERNATLIVTTGTPRDLDLEAAVHEELNRLPEKYRAPVILCDLEGRTHQQAARSLGWPIGTVKSRQSEGRKRLRDQLTHRGITLAAAGAVFNSLNQVAIASMPTKVALEAVSAAMNPSAHLIAGFGISADVLILTKGALRTMLWIKVRSLTVATLAVGLATGGATAYVSGSQNAPTKAGQAATDRPAPSAQTSPKPAVDTPRTKLRAQQLATRKAKAAYQIAKLTRELNQIAVEEYEEITYPGDLATVESEIHTAKSDLARANDRVEWANRMFKKGYVSQAQRASEDLALQKARFALEQAQSKLSVLRQYTKGKTIKELESDVEKAHSDELAKQDALEVAQIRELELQELERQTHPEKH